MNCPTCETRPAACHVPMDEGSVRLCWECAHAATCEDCKCSAEEIAPTPAGAHAATFTEVIEAALPYLRRVALRLTRNESDADDVIQDSVIRAFTSWEKFDPERGIEPRRWLSKIVKRGFLTEIRKRKLRPVSADVEMMGDDGRGLGEYLDAMNGLNLIDGDQRAVLRLAMDGESYQDIATTLNIPIGTVMSRLYRARRNLETVIS